MRKRAIALFVVAVGLILGICSIQVYSQEDMTTLADKAFEHRQRPPAVFVHDKHNEEAEIDECSVCHHVYRDGKKVEDESSEDMDCSECHKVAGGSQARSLMEAYHDLCKDCHRSRKVGPVTCGECHQKKPL